MVTDEMIVEDMRRTGMMDALSDEQIVKIFKDKSLSWALTELSLNMRECWNDIKKTWGIKL